MEIIRRSEALNSLQVLLLVFVKFGLTTPYDLMSHAGMSVGLTSPALKRLEQAGLLTFTPGPRKRMRYAITEKGEDKLQVVLESGRKDNWGLGQFDVFESVPRAILLAWVYSGSEDARRCVDWAAAELKAQWQKKEGRADELHSSMVHLQGDLFNDAFVPDKDVLIATAYQWMKTASDAALLKMQAEVMVKMTSLLSELPPALKMAQDDPRA
jgi:DNA-binding PadR family transcriptional regulator